MLDEVEDAVLMDGEIGVSTPLDFRRALDLRPKTSVVVLASPGGLVASSLILADDIHRLGLSTFIPEGFGCYSACAFVFLAGKNRLASGELGVHQMASDVPDPSGIQYSTADILDALEDFDVPTPVLTRMFRTPNDSMYVFSAAEVESMEINRMAAAVEQPQMPEPGHRPAVEEPSSARPVSGAKLALYQGLDFFGSDLQSSRMPDAVQCATACMENNYCQAFTFNANPSLKKGPNCFLKSSTDRPEAYRDAISGVLLREGQPPVFSVDAIDPTVDVAKGIDYPGGDLQTGPAHDADTLMDCRQTCIGTKSCVAFSFVTKQKQCWLKAGVGAPRTAIGVTSGTKRFVTFEPMDVIDLE